MPGKFIAAADVKEFEGAASSGAGGNVAKGASGQQQTIGDQRKQCVYVRCIECGFGGAYIWASLEGTMSLSSPTSARPVARIRFSPFSVSGSSVVPVCRPLSDHSVSPWRMMKARGIVIAGFGRKRRGPVWQ